MRTRSLTTPARAALRRVACALLVAMFAARTAGAQDWPDRPVSLAGGRVTVGGDATLTVGTTDSGYFNFTDYERSALRLVRFDVIATLRANAHLSCLAELRAEGDSSDGHWTAGTYAAYVRVQPWTARAFEMQAGRIPPAFGAFTRRPYATDNPLIGYPLAYQYLTSLRAEAIPATADDLAAMRGRGWYAYYPVGASYWEHGVPAMSAFQLRHGRARQGGRAGRPRGDQRQRHRRYAVESRARRSQRRSRSWPCASPRVRCPGCSSASPARAGRSSRRRCGTSCRPATPGGSTGSRHLAPTRRFHTGTGWCGPNWCRPTGGCRRSATPAITAPPRATAWLTEGRYKLAPGLYVAARYDRMLFSRIESSQGSIDVGRRSLAASKRAPATRCARNVTAQGQLAVQPARRWARRPPRTSRRRRSCCGSDPGRARADRWSSSLLPRLPAARQREPLAVVRGRVEFARAPVPAGRRGRARSSPDGPVERDVLNRRAGRRVLRDGAARRVRRPRERARVDGSAQRDVRAARARHHRRHDGRLPEQRPHLPQRVLALEGEALRSRALRGGHVEVGALRSARASCASSATSTRT